MRIDSFEFVLECERTVISENNLSYGKTILTHGRIFQKQNDHSESLSGLLLDQLAHRKVPSMVKNPRNHDSFL